jgi:hypothetical protein
MTTTTVDAAPGAPAPAGDGPPVSPLTAILRRKISGNHFYSQDGQPRYDVGGPAEASTLGLIPSVTTVGGTRRKPAFEIMRAKAMVAAMFAHPPTPEQTLEQFEASISEHIEEANNPQLDFGKRFHGYVEPFAREKKQPQIPPEHPDALVWGMFNAWWDENVLAVYEVEAPIVNFEQGYAGKLDLAVKLKDVGNVILDIKTQKVRYAKKSGEAKPAFYPDWAEQGHGYRNGQLAMPTSQHPGVESLKDFKFASLVVASNGPSRPFLKVWDEDEMARAKKGFDLTLALWYHETEFAIEPRLDLRAKLEDRRKQPGIVTLPSPEEYAIRGLATMLRDETFTEKSTFHREFPLESVDHVLRHLHGLTPRDQLDPRLVAPDFEFSGNVDNDLSTLLKKWRADEIARQEADVNAGKRGRQGLASLNKGIDSRAIFFHMNYGVFAADLVQENPFKPPADMKAATIGLAGGPEVDFPQPSPGLA